MRTFEFLVRCIRQTGCCLAAAIFVAATACGSVARLPVAAGTAAYRNGMFVGQHGAWNRNPRSGYKVIDDVGNTVWRVTAAK